MAQIKTDWKQTLKQLKFEYLEKEHPDFYKLSGGERMKLKPWNDDTSNGLTNAIMDFLKYHRHYCNRINCIGLNRRINGKMVYTPSSTRKGVSDIHSIINGQHVSIEVKCKATKDRMSKEQDQERKRVESAGGIYFVATDMDSFIDWYVQTF
jgi:hypothetical protein